ncbi:MAG TPA: hypothetical protein VFZ66_27355 [Herpetosiphonaceae bacterium]
MTQADPAPPVALPLLTAIERAALHQGLADRDLPDLPLLEAALEQGEQILPFLSQLAELLRAKQPGAALTALDAALEPVVALDTNASHLASTLRELTTAWDTLLTRCPGGALPVSVLTDAATMRMVAETAERVSEQAQELALRAADRARLLDQRAQG